MSLENGKKRAALWLGIGASGCVIVGSVSGFYAGWTRNVEASVTMQRMVNADDEALQKIVPKVEACHGVNELQEYRISAIERDNARRDEAISRLADLMQTYLQSRMKAGEIPR